MIRYLKILLVVFVGLQGLTYFCANALNWDAASAVVGQVLAQGERAYYPHNILPLMDSPALANATLVVIVTGELLVGLVSIFGATRMFASAGKPADAFNASKRFAVLGCGLALLVWFGLFTVVGGGMFQMWQHALGQGSLNDAHKFLVPSGIILLFVNMKDE